jgi:hypothetical protein
MTPFKLPKPSVSLAHYHISKLAKNDTRVYMWGCRLLLRFSLHFLAFPAVAGPCYPHPAPTTPWHQVASDGWLDPRSGRHHRCACHFAGCARAWAQKIAALDALETEMDSFSCSMVVEVHNHALSGRGSAVVRELGGLW